MIADLLIWAFVAGFVALGIDGLAEINRNRRKRRTWWR